MLNGCWKSFLKWPIKFYHCDPDTSNIVELQCYHMLAKELGFVYLC
jgi:hypothetical protein